MTPKVAKQINPVYEEDMHTSSTKSIREYLPARPAVKKKLVQARIEKDLVESVKKIMRQEDGLSWAKLLTACLRSFVDDRGQK